VYVELTLQGSERLERTVLEAASVLGDLRPLWTRVDRHFTRRHRRQFETSGALTGGWQPLSTEYLAWKAEARGVRTSIMQRTGRLKASLLSITDTDAVHRMTPDSWERGTKRVSERGFPYPIAHQTGAGRLPKREVLVWDRTDNEFVIDEARKLIGRALRG
jgi:phage gpG-like protein